MFFHINFTIYDSITVYGYIWHTLFFIISIDVFYPNILWLSIIFINFKNCITTKPFCLISSISGKRTTIIPSLSAPSAISKSSHRTRTSKQNSFVVNFQSIRKIFSDFVILIKILVFDIFGLDSFSLSWKSNSSSQRSPFGFLLFLKQNHGCCLRSFSSNRG